MLEGEPDYVPLFEFHIADSVMSEFLGREVCDPGRIGITRIAPPFQQAMEYLPDYVQFHAAAGYDFVPLKFGVGSEILRIAASRTIFDDNKAPGATPWGQEDHGFLTSWQDLESFPWPIPGQGDELLFQAAGELLPEGIRLIAHGGGMLSHARNYMGMQNFWLTLHEDENLAVAILNKLQELQFTAIDRVTNHPKVGAFLLDEDLGHSTGLMESPTFLRKHVFPFFRKIGDLLQSKDIVFLLHSCGRIDEVIEDLIACGVKALHPLQPKAMDIVKIKNRYGDRIAVLGNADLDSVLTRGGRKTIRAEVRRLIAALAPGGGYAISSSSSIPDWVPTKNYREFLAACLEFGRYPVTA